MYLKHMADQLEQRLINMPIENDILDTCNQLNKVLAQAEAAFLAMPKPADPTVLASIATALANSTAIASTIVGQLPAPVTPAAPAA